jgi:hypothetical protein
MMAEALPVNICHSTACHVQDNAVQVWLLGLVAF